MRISHICKDIILAFAIISGTASTCATQYSSAPGDDNDKKTGLGAVIGNALKSVVATDRLDVAALEGSWKYSGAAVSFMSDNMLQKAGGTAAAATIQEKIEPMFKRAGFDKMTAEFDSDSTFTMTLGRTKLTGAIAPREITESSPANFTLELKVGGKIRLAMIDAYITKAGKDKMDLMMDVSSLLTIARTAGALTGNSSIQSLAKLLESYDGLCAGFALDRVKK
ncbi:MAG: DUF4923 family protein [Pseudoflavonifractor sp.]|nr:DUF4923 family protein [Alloprevotella sp.]MCM1116092.1 DUF4923 family protein [Pseudoflavonifractor sp.]